MIKKPVMIQIRNGLEARPVALLVQVASQYDSEIYVESEERHVNAKSIMGMMTLGLNYGDSIVVSANGTDEEISEWELIRSKNKNQGCRTDKIFVGRQPFFMACMQKNLFVASSVQNVKQSYL